MIREIWCRCVRSCAAHVASSCDNVTTPNDGCRPRRLRSSAVSFISVSSPSPFARRLRKIVQKFRQRFAFAVVRVPRAIERSKGLLLARFQNHSHSRNPVFVLTMNQVRHHCRARSMCSRPRCCPSTSPAIRAAARREPPASAQAAQSCFRDPVPSKSPMSLFSPLPLLCFPFFYSPLPTSLFPASNATTA